MTGANIAGALTATAVRQPGDAALLFPLGRRGGEQRYRTFSYRELDEDSQRIAIGLGRLGLGQGTRVALMVPPGIEFFALTFGLFKAGAVPVLIDPGIGPRHLKTCLAEARPEAFIGIPKAHAARALLGWGKSTIRTLVTVGMRGPWGGFSLDDVRHAGEVGSRDLPPTREDDLAAILFTSGSTGVPKGAVYTHGTFAAQVDLLRRAFGVRPGEIDLPTFPLFALFDPALGMTTVIPFMDPTRPASVDPREILDPIRRFRVTNLFGSPALLDRVGRSREAMGVRLSSVGRVISAGAPVPAPVLERFARLLEPGVPIFTPYGATEALPVAVVSSQTILGETRVRTDEGAGVCIGQPVEGVRVEVIAVSDDPIAEWSDGLRVAPGTIGEFVVAGPNVSTAYFGREEATRLAKIRGVGGEIWHRMGDVGYRDEQGRLWFCGRKSHRVVTASGTLFTEPCEGIFNRHPEVRRTALVGVRRGGETLPVLCVELDAATRGAFRERVRRELLALGARHEQTRGIREILFHDQFPVDIRHNAKIFREKLAVWADDQLR